MSVDGLPLAAAPVLLLSGCQCSAPSSRGGASQLENMPVVADDVPTHCPALMDASTAQVWPIELVVVVRDVRAIEYGAAGTWHSARVEQVVFGAYAGERIRFLVPIGGPLASGRQVLSLNGRDDALRLLKVSAELDLAAQRALAEVRLACYALSAHEVLQLRERAWDPTRSLLTAEIERVFVRSEHSAKQQIELQLGSQEPQSVRSSAYIGFVHSPRAEAPGVVFARLPVEIIPLLRTALSRREAYPVVHAGDGTQMRSIGFLGPTSAALDLLGSPDAQINQLAAETVSRDANARDFLVAALEKSLLMPMLPSEHAARRVAQIARLLAASGPETETGDMLGRLLTQIERLEVDSPRSGVDSVLNPQLTWLLAARVGADDFVEHAARLLRLRAHVPAPWDAVIDEADSALAFEDRLALFAARQRYRSDRDMQLSVSDELGDPDSLSSLMQRSPLIVFSRDHSRLHVVPGNMLRILTVERAHPSRMRALELASSYEVIDLHAGASGPVALIAKTSSSVACAGARAADRPRLIELDTGRVHALPIAWECVHRHEWLPDEQLAFQMRPSTYQASRIVFRYARGRITPVLDAAEFVEPVIAKELKWSRSRSKYANLRAYSDDNALAAVVTTIRQPGDPLLGLHATRLSHLVLYDLRSGELLEASPQLESVPIALAIAADNSQIAWLDRKGVLHVHLISEP